MQPFSLKSSKILSRLQSFTRKNSQRSQVKPQRDSQRALEEKSEVEKGDILIHQEVEVSIKASLQSLSPAIKENLESHP